MYRCILIIVISLLSSLHAESFTFKTSYTDSKYEAATTYYVNQKFSVDLRLVDFHQSDFESCSIGFTFPVYQSESLVLKSSFHYGPSLNQATKTFFNYYSSLNYEFNGLDFSGLYNYYQISSVVHKLKLRSSIPIYYSKTFKFLYEIEFNRTKGKTTYETQPILQFKYDDILIELRDYLLSSRLLPQSQ